MGRNYEALFIFPSSMKDTEVEQSVEQVREEIARQGGEVTRVQVLGKRDFARPMKKKRGGIYVRMRLALDPKNVAALRARLRLRESIFRVQLLLVTDAMDAATCAEVRATDAGRESGRDLDEGRSDG